MDGAGGQQCERATWVCRPPQPVSGGRPHTSARPLRGAATPGGLLLSHLPHATAMCTMIALNPGMGRPAVPPMSTDIWAPMSAPGARPSIVECSCKRVYVATLALERLFVCPSLAALWLTVAVCGIMWLCGVSWRPAPGAVWPLLASSGDSLPSPSRLHASPGALGRGGGSRW